MWYYIISVSAVLYVLYEYLTNIWRVPNLTKKCVMVTGCDTGFGNMLVMQLVQAGVTTFAACLTEEGENNLKKQVAIDEARGKLITFRMDVTKQESVDAARDYVQKHLGAEKGMWALVNNAGILGQTGPLEWLSIDDWQKPLDVNCLGVIRVTQAFKPLIKRNRGRIIITTSFAGRTIVPFGSAYCVSKFAAEGYADSLRAEMMRFGVTVHIIEPGFMATNMTSDKNTKGSFQQLWERQSESVRQEYGENYVNGVTESMTRTVTQFVSKKIHKVPNACMHAIASQWPKRRYVIGVDANVFLSLVWLPTPVCELIMQSIMYFMRYPKPAAARNDESVW